MRLLPLVVLLAACSTPTETVWLEGFGYGWDRFNHRVSHLSVTLDDTAAHVAVIGGTSTTGLNPELPPGCSAATCDEFPFYDFSPVEVHWARTTSTKVVAGVGVGEALATAEGATITVPVSFDRKAKGEAVAVLRGFTIDTDHPLSGGEACYYPENGWHPRRIAISLGAVTISDDGLGAEVSVTAHFEAGNSLEDERQCVDEVRTEAVVPILVDVLVVAGKGLSSAEGAISHEMSYAYGNGPVSPDEQADPDWTERSWSVDEGVLVGAWRTVDFQFHVDDSEDRGAYLRTLAFRADPVGGAAWGHATNYSPGTQLSGFDYAFSGTVVGIGFDGEVERGTASGTVEELVDDQGVALPLTLPL